MIREPRQSRRLDGDRLPPHATGAEQVVLGCCLLAPNQSIRKCQEWFKGEKALYELRHQIIFAAMEHLFGENKEVDLITLLQVLRDRGQLEQVGGVGYINSLEDLVPSAESLEQYLEIVWEKFLARALIQRNTEVTSLVVERNGVDEQILARAKRLHEEFERKIQSRHITPRFLKKAGDFGEGFFRLFFGDPDDVPGLELPIPFACKVRMGEATLVSGDDGAGKSTVLNFFMLHLAQQLKEGEKIVIASFEMKPEVTLWMLASQLIGSKKLPETEESKKKATAALAYLNKHFLFYDFTGIGDWRDLMDTFGYAVEHEKMRIGCIDSVMRIGIGDDDYALQALVAAYLANFCIDHDVHLLFVLHENKADAKGKAKIRGSKLWTANSCNIWNIRINPDKGEKMDKAKSELESVQALAREYPGKDYSGEIKDLEATIENMRRQWDTELNLRKQRYPGTRQNGSKRFWFDLNNFQFRAHWEDPPVNWLERWKKQKAEKEGA